MLASDIESNLAEQEAQGRIVTLLANDAGVLAIFAVADTIKESSRQAVEIKTLRMRKRFGATGMTGDGITMSMRQRSRRPRSALRWAGRARTPRWKRPTWSS